MPGRPDGLHFKLVSEDPSALGGKATRKDITVYFDAGETLCMNLLMFVPNDADGPVPAFLGVNFKGNDATFGEAARRWPYEYIISHGYAVATFWRDDVDPDWHDGFKNGIHGLLDAGKERMADSWGTIAAWAWGLSRALDYLETDKDIDSRRVAVFGHSRLGKTALWCAAQDERFAAAISNNSGYGGAATSKCGNGERVVDFLRYGSWDWFCENFKVFTDDLEDKKPYDQSFLLALIAPRLLIVGSAKEDKGADPESEFLTSLHASSAWELLGEKGLVTPDRMPLTGEVLDEGNVCYHYREGRHFFSREDWNTYIRILNKKFK
jgi:hypothetical protein